jgi:hypothetical protein
VSEREKFSAIVKLITFKRHHRDGIRSSRKVQLGPSKQRAKNLVWFGEIER